MKVILQRVTHASCVVDEQVTGEIKDGYMALVGISTEDQEDVLEKMADKVVNLRVFSDEEGKMNRSLLDVKGEILSISQFTLYADAKKGRRPSFTHAAKPDVSLPMYNQFNELLKAKGVHVETGIFGADMKISLLNDGPVTIILDSDQLF
ncbi:D-tyrosyl-tRNA(Tyr) deacylase [Kandleria vitulina]|jgi:D-tyrosyl-tRNA(Tyr) deacylase|uniref:D-aminoacyl-tRNA deacylase n=1 Tax=Kandleria vitulina TaxID=1630 RepID=A0A1H2RSG2_9FIRM|nr:D-aminoacyl-tRNA deacylase [Kandleria vitulina]MEE0988658.1 D-aminoacyl-tRNA deacylase [Kandleria vitulina]SDW22090.1 D-tyrosyl-tRNA(Tyr) deacylase [Kandleria vitulina]HAH74714.1 D-tyrosyl-tRNA(Tyr) deacylase [Kandleria vitulina]